MGSEHASPEYDVKKFLNDETNRCVSCGLCLPHCPTYRLLESEADSPRGRIAMMNGVVNGRIPLNEKFKLHLDRCLTCRACESVCPNNVAYGQLIDSARAMIQVSATNPAESADRAKPENNPFLKKLHELVVQPEKMARMRWALYFFQKSGLLGLLRSLHWLQKMRFWRRSGIDTLLRQLPPVEFPYSGERKKNSFQRTWHDFYPAVGEEKGKVGLFLGCVARLTDAATLNAGIYVLNRLGYGVCIPAGQTCCGALHQHAGDAENAALLKQRNVLAFDKPELAAVISTASGCGVQLAEYNLQDRAQKTESDRAGAFPDVLDISKFLVAAEGWEKLTIAPLAKKIVVQEPCSLRNVLGDQDYPYRLIHHIPGAEVVFLADNDQCCGAAGSYFIRQPALADRLLDDKINAIVQSGAQILLTSNIGCALHISGRIREIGSEIEVMHPVTLLARQMGMQKVQKIQ